MVLRVAPAPSALSTKTPHLPSVAKRVFQLSADDFPRRAVGCVGTHADLDRTWESVRPVATTLVDAFYATLDLRDPDAVSDALDELPCELRGIGYEGAGMGLMALDTLSPRGWRLRRFILGRGAPHQCLVYLGAGMTLARVPGNPMRFVNRHDPALRWLLLDGYGFFDGFFRWERCLTRPPALPGYGPNAYDQGVGRSLWFLTGADVTRIRDIIAGFAVGRRPDLWSGVGLACAYAVGVHDGQTVAALRRAAGPLVAQVAVGAAVAALFREQSGQHAPFTDLACSALWDLDGYSVAALAHEAGRSLAHTPVAPPSDRYPRWRAAIHAAWLEGPTAPGRDTADEPAGSRVEASCP